jgi:cell wall assembly regulator SMI1
VEVIAMTEGIGVVWAGIEAWLRAKAPRTFRTLNPPANADTLADLERRLGLELPGELTASMRRHNGADNTLVGPGFSFPGNFHLLDADTVAATAAVGASLRRDDPQAAEYWHEAWIPVAGDFCGDRLFYDTRRRRPFGTVFYHHQIDGPFGGAWDSLEDLLRDTLYALERRAPSRVRRLPADYPRLSGWPTSTAVVDDGELAWQE